MVIFNPWKVLWNWIAFSQNSFVISPCLLYHLIRRHLGRLANEAFTSNKLNGLKITNCNNFHRMFCGMLQHISNILWIVQNLDISRSPGSDPLPLLRLGCLRVVFSGWGRGGNLTSPSPPPSRFRVNTKYQRPDSESYFEIKEKFPA